MAIATINPATGETLKTFQPLSNEVLDEKIARAAAAWQHYGLTTPEQHPGWLRAAWSILLSAPTFLEHDDVASNRVHRGA